MKYCVTFNSNFRYLRGVDEIILPYTGIKKDIVSFIQDTFNKNQRIIIYINEDTIEAREDYCWIDEDLIPSIKKLIQDNWNIVLKIPCYKDLTDLIASNCISFFYSQYPITIEGVEAQAISGASDIYITESLGFRLKDLQGIKEKFGVQFRVIPNIAQCLPAARNYMNSMQKFWVRPEDTEIYEEYIDVFELAGGEDNSRLSVVYEIYKQQQWLGSLNDLILDFGDAIVVPNTGMNPHFASMRLNCGKACLYSSCSICPQMGILAQNFNEVGLEVIKPRKKIEKTEEEKEKILNKLGEKYGLRANEETMLPE